MDFNDGGGFQDLSGAESAEEDDRSDEIKQLLSEGLDDATFDEESEHSFAANSSNHSSSNDKHPQQLMHGGNISTNINGSNGHGHGMENMYSSQNPFPSLRSSDIGVNFNGNGNGHGATNNNGGTLASLFNGINRELEDGNQNQNQANVNMNGSGGGSGKKVRFDASSSLAQRDIQLLNGRQSDRGLDEMEVINPTISLLHQNHCPQKQNLMGNGNISRSGSESSNKRLSSQSNVSDGSGNGLASKLEQMTNLLEHRDRQIQRLEEDAKTYSKDKRSLNHEIGLMKTEMIQMKNSQDELQKVIELRDEEILYLKTKMTEAIEEYEQVRNQELLAKEEVHRYMDEAEKLQQQIQLLSSIGSSAHQAEIDDVVRQVREKHAKEIGQWQSLVADLESQLQIFKRNQQHLHNESVVVEIEHMGTQTDAVRIEHMGTQMDVVRTEHMGTLTDEVLRMEKETETIPIPSPPAPVVVPVPVPEPPPKKAAVITVDFGQTVNFIPESDTSLEVKEGQKKQFKSPRPSETGGGDAAIHHLQGKVNTNNEKDTTTLDKYKEALAKSEEDKQRLIDFYEKEVEDYKTKLAVLPSELYNVWTKQQEELGLLYANISANSSYISPEKSAKNKTPVRTEPTVSNSITTAGVAAKTDEAVIRLQLNAGCQTDTTVEIQKRTASSETQTDEKPVSISYAQTDKKPVSVSYVQTDERPVSVSCAQTDTPVVSGPFKNIPNAPATPSVSHGNGGSTSSNSNASSSCTGGCTPRSTVRERETSTSSVVIQTEETLETFNVLGELIQDWAKEVAVTSKRAQLAEKEVILTSTKYRELLKAFKACKQDWKERENYLRQKCEDQKKKFINVLSTVSSKLDIVE